jgi:lipopolysaccharide biosynthesis glycosyltransferase
VKVGFLHVGSDPDGRLCAEGMAVSVKRAMPAVSVVQFTDERTEQVAGADEVYRLWSQSGSMAMARFWCQAQLDGEWLFLDTDVIVQQDVRKVFRSRFHIAVTTRNWRHLKPAKGFTERMPFNTGVIFSRSQKFWQDCYDQLKASEIDDQDFMGHQEVICDLVASDRYEIAYVKGSRFNCPPYVPGGKEGGDQELSDRMVKEAAIVHYKGAQRKQMMLDRIRAEGLCA